MRFPDRVDEVVQARIAREVPAATDQLPTAALGSVGGGRMDVDPTDKKGLKTLQKVFQFDVVLPERMRLRYIGTRVQGRIDHGTEPIGWQWYRSLRQLFLRRFDA
jgi:putative peptide zinc metalloprotease protein